MRLLYSIGISIYAFLIGIAALFTPKAKQRHRGGKEALKYLEKTIDPNFSYVWFHVASLGEFEQGRPIIERFRTEHPEKKILVTFFSPSGFEVRKNYAGADAVCYMPIDKTKNVRKFISIVKPEIAIFVKYEFWANYFFLLNRRNIPIYLISAKFREDQIFFKPYGGFFRKILKCINTLYVQDDNSRKLLEKIGIKNIKIAGDTRFDRVLEIKRSAKVLPIAKEFAAGNKVLVAGSTWKEDEEFIIQYINKETERKLIIAPHEVNSNRINEICLALRRSFVLYSETTPEEAAKADVLIIDTIGILSSLYQYGDIAYIGGGFGVGIHNTLEAAVWGCPILFGPNYTKFKEAVDLVKADAAKPIHTHKSFDYTIRRFELKMEESSFSAANYVKKNSGATEMIYQDIFENDNDI